MKMPPLVRPEVGMCQFMHRATSGDGVSGNTGFWRDSGAQVGGQSAYLLMCNPPASCHSVGEHVGVVEFEQPFLIAIHTCIYIHVYICHHIHSAVCMWACVS